MSDTQTSPYLRYLPIIATLIAIVSGSFAIWSYVKPAECDADMSGTWTITFKVEESSVDRFIGDVMVYDIYMTQDGAELSGRGEQVTYNGNNSKLHYKLELLPSSVKDNKMNIAYKLDGSRPTEGMLYLEITAKNHTALKGRFEGGAADVKGLVSVDIRK